jgi:hypothetical protein
MDKDEARIIIFGTESNIIHMKNSKTWIADATFKVVPVNFTQLFTIQIAIRNKFKPMIYCLMKKKDVASYTILFEVLKTKFGLQKPERIVLDFEYASFSVISVVFKDVIVYGCLFHLSQIIWRKLQNLNYTELYKTKSSFFFSVKLICSLSFVPANRISEFSLLLKKYFSRENFSSETFCIFDWFYEMFVENKCKLKNHECVFWSVYDRVLNKIPRITNIIEDFS